MDTSRPTSKPVFQRAECIDARHPDRAEVEDFVARVYRQRFDARLSEFMPHLLAFRDGQGRLLAAVGLRCGGEGRLFVERYLQDDAESRLGAELGQRVARQQIVELGNFAAHDPGAARELILALIPLLRQAGMRWVMFVATRQLRNAFRRLGLAPRHLMVARGECLGEDAASWGRYYDEAPELLFGDLHRASDEAPASVAEPSMDLCAVAR